MIKQKAILRAAACLGISLLAGILLAVWYRAGIARVRRIPLSELSEYPSPVLFSLDGREYQEDGSCILQARAMAEDAIFPFDNYASGERGDAMLLSFRLGILQGEDVCVFPSRAFVPELSEAPDALEQRAEQALARADWTQVWRDKVATYGISALVPARFAGQGGQLVLVLFFPEGEYLVPLEETL